MRYNTKEIEAKMGKSVSGYEEMLGTIRANQANAGVLFPFDDELRSNL